MNRYHLGCTVLLVIGVINVFVGIELVGSIGAWLIGPTMIILVALGGLFFLRKEESEA